MATRVAINGLGRIGRLVLRQMVEEDEFEIVAMNDIAPLDNLAYLTRHDSVHPEADALIEAMDGRLLWNEMEIPFYSVPEPAQLPWKDLEVDVVVEASGVFTSREKAAGHLEAGAQHVIISAPGKGVDATICIGVNEETFDPEKHRVISNASCTTNCIAVVAKVLHEAFEIETGFITTIHAATNSQAVVDSPRKKWRRGRSVLLNIVPTTTGAAIATTQVLPELKGKLNGMAIRVPVAAGSLLDFVVRTRDPVTVEKINSAFESATHEDALDGIITVSDEELVSSDIIGCTYSAVVDRASTMVLGEHTAKVLAWYDNEWGYAARVVDLVAYVGLAMRG